MEQRCHSRAIDLCCLKHRVFPYLPGLEVLSSRNMVDVFHLGILVTGGKLGASALRKPLCRQLAIQRRIGELGRLDLEMAKKGALPLLQKLG